MSDLSIKLPRFSWKDDALRRAAYTVLSADNLRWSVLRANK